MMYVAMQDKRISNPVILEIDPQVIEWQGTKYADMNATKSEAHIGEKLEDFNAIHFRNFSCNYFALTPEEKPYYQAEVLVKTHIPLKYIKKHRELRYHNTQPAGIAEQDSLHGTDYPQHPDRIHLYGRPFGEYAEDDNTSWRRDDNGRVCRTYS